MMPIGRPVFSVVTPTTSPEERRWVSTATVRAFGGVAADVTDATLNLFLDATLSRCATSCGLARARGLPVTLAQEAVRATWQADSWYWPTGWYPSYAGQPATLLLPWRAPIISIAITEGETELVEDTDFRLLGSGVVERINGCWSTGSIIVVDYVAGWLPDDDENPPPDDLVQLVANQARMSIDQQSLNFNLRSEDIPGVWSGTYNVAGGDAVDTSGLMMPLYEALGPYRAPPSFA